MVETRRQIIPGRDQEGAQGDILLKQRNEWENFLRDEGEKVRRLTAETEQAEREIDAIVYKLFDLTWDEIALLESSPAGQY